MMKYNLTRNIVFALLIGGALVGVNQSSAAQETKKQGTGAETAFSEIELQAFVKAYVDYQNIRASYGPALERAKDAQQKKRIEQEANTKVKQSLEAQGLTSERYNKIFAAVNGNAELRQKVLNKVEDERQES
jgi:Na+/phosphate symporter